LSVADHADHADHDAFVTYPCMAHVRKSGFWTRVDDLGRPA
jgi:hypothetical protein